MIGNYVYRYHHGKMRIENVVVDKGGDLTEVNLDKSKV